jgi:molecular chaperone GrpE
MEPKNNDQKQELEHIETPNHIEKGEKFETEELIKKNEILEATIKKLEERAKHQEQTIFYLKADIENIRKNTLKEIQSTVHRSNVKILSLFLSVLDDYERSLDYARENKEIFEGLSITYNTFLKVLKDLEIEEIVTTGEFNPELHEAISSISSDEQEKNSISTVVQKGYSYKKQVIRPAKVIVVI